MSKIKLSKKFIVNLKGKEFVRYEGLLDAGHQIGIKSIETKLIQIPNESNGNIAIAMAKITTEDDKVFQEIGDAGPNSVNRMIQPHIIRMAFTRAKARALRDLTNIGMTAFEELGNDTEVIGKQQHVQTIKKQQGANAKPIHPTKASSCSGCGAKISDKVEQFSISRFKRALCMECQGKVKQ